MVRQYASGYLGACVNQIDEVAVGVGIHDGLNHLLIFQRASPQPHQRLTAAAQGRLEEREEVKAVEIPIQELAMQRIQPLC